MENDLQGMILAKLTSIEQTIGQTAVAVAKLEERVNGSHSGVSDHEGRIRSLERWKWGFTGVLTIITTAGAMYAQARGAQ